jgi:hypothetical protein
MHSNAAASTVISGHSNAAASTVISGHTNAAASTVISGPYVPGQVIPGSKGVVHMRVPKETWMYAPALAWNGVSGMDYREWQDQFSGAVAKEQRAFMDAATALGYNDGDCFNSDQWLRSQLVKLLGTLLGGAGQGPLFARFAVPVLIEACERHGVWCPAAALRSFLLGFRRPAPSSELWPGDDQVYRGVPEVMAKAAEADSATALDVLWAGLDARFGKAPQHQVLQRLEGCRMRQDPGLSNESPMDFYTRLLGLTRAQLTATLGGWDNIKNVFVQGLPEWVQQKLSTDWLAYCCTPANGDAEAPWHLARCAERLAYWEEHNAYNKVVTAPFVMPRWPQLEDDPQQDDSPRAPAPRGRRRRRGRGGGRGGPQH